MGSTELGNMRLKQVAITNGLILTAMIIFFTIINVFTIAFAHYFLVLGVLVLIQGVFGFIKGDSTKSIIPIFEKVAIYEKQKLIDFTKEKFGLENYYLERDSLSQNVKIIKKRIRKKNSPTAK
jgi:hypothetical protein